MRDRRFQAAAAAAFAAALVLLAPAPAWAGVAERINEFVCGMLRDACNWMFAQETRALASISYDGILGADFDEMFTAQGSTSVYGIAETVWEVAVLPIGCGVLSLVFTIQLIHVSQRMDGNQAMPGVKDVVFMLVFFAVFTFLITHSWELMEDVYQVFQMAINKTTAALGTGGALDAASISVAPEADDAGALVGMLIVALLSWLAVLAAYCLSLVVCWARALQLYVMAAFAPIPLSLMALEETRQVGVGYLKNFASVCIAGLVLVMLLVSFPAVMGSVTGAAVSTPVVIGFTSAGALWNGLTLALQWLAMSLLFCFALVKSGSWANSIVGGL